ncbi:ABC transporter ATP-binding protein [Verminephrobacter eiseniae]|uniref:ABC transporter related n=1 Tax=Verminephrobacter eiseniae (strain EF01-2) TaxID=391735 RepID=A1WMP1_VEREI|nr:ABC transporter ATP-binding protein [Verminephrobacter eiseniae]ABM58898.1 ABC transporter related [Verminephrobacter eiseniae EF01-2]MCW5284461.1 ABC transporter ATP-binding protein [Verminephrobacter eiseniae]MCW5302167.1 ABC transporter ATP-binding protein [Verminephrobacter eiseniae]MCW8180861.1 ABC transporter ATP-binding protein [Verminephrobacter eiseniae]MCW8192299.1 ABC transporter ATP-binding protein [Verminephrobacter eiseniae]
MAYLQLRGIEKFFGEHHAIKGIDLSIAQGEFIVFVGPSGCGKSTLLRLIAGLERVDGGTLLLDGSDITDRPSSRRDLAMVFQSYALYPHMSVYQNMSFALQLAKADPAIIRTKVERAAAILNLGSYLQRRPRELSGGQRQRVAIGRAIVRAPKVFLFDEPLSNLDAALRGQTRVEIAKLHRDLGATTIYVTHDQVEAMTLADRVVVLRDGQIEQVGTPLTLYDQPANRFVAQFIGTPQMNMLPYEQLPPVMQQQCPAAAVGGAVGLRPECLAVHPAGHPGGAFGQGAAALGGQVELIEALGAETLIYLRTAQGAQVVARQSERTALQPGHPVALDIAIGQAHWFDSTGRVVPAARHAH